MHFHMVKFYSDIMVKKVVNWTLVIVWLVIIFMFSNRTGTQSTGDSRGTIERVLITIKMDEGSIETFSKKVEPYVRKFAHVFEYFILSLLLLNALKPHSYIEAIVIIMCLLFASLDEFHQLFIPGRSGEIKDIIIDMLGPLITLTFHKYQAIVK